MTWTTVKLGDVCKIINGSTPLRSRKDFWEKGTVSWFTIDDLRVDTMYLTADLNRYVDLEGMNQFIEGEGDQPVLEYLDTINFTYRLGNKRKLSKDKYE